MAGFEDLIRDTLDKQGEPTHANRARVYASARSALERMIDKQGADADGDAAQAQREQLEGAIDRIEDEHVARMTPMPTPGDPASPVLTASRDGHRPTDEPEADNRSARTRRRDAKRASKLLVDGRPRKKPFVKLLLWVIILAGLATVGWWAWTFGPDYAESLGSVPNPPQVGPESTGGPSDTSGPVDAASGDWIAVFDPAANIDAVAAGERASSEIVRDNGRTWLRLASTEGDDGRIRIAVPPGVMETIAGRNATFEATVRTAEGAAPHSFSIACDFRSLGTCNRTRFDAQENPQPFVFAADLGEGTGEDEAGTLTLNTDLEGEGRAVDLGTIRVSVGD